MTALDRCRDAWNDAGLAWQDRGDDTATAQAPGHSAADRSVSFRQIEGQVLVNSHADDKDQVLAEVGLSVADLFDEPRGATYQYSDGRTVRRTPDKRFSQSGNTKGDALYRVELLPERPEAQVYVAEGEKDVHALESVGATAVCPAMGAGKANRFDWSPLAGRDVTIVADDDEPGRKHAAQVAQLLADHARSVTIVKAKAGKDAADHIATGHSLGDLQHVDLPTGPDNAEFAEFAEAVPAPLEREVDTPDFPFYAFPRVIGEFVLALSESTQTDPGLAGSAVLAALSAAAGGYYQVQVRDGYTEPVNLFNAALADSGERKSSVMRAATAPLREVERELYDEMKPLLDQQATEREIAERYAEKAKRDAGNAANPEQRMKLTSDAVTAASQAGEMKAHAAPRIIGDDVTVEALGSLIAEQGGRFALLSAEGGFFAEMAGRYSAKTDISSVLMAHAGDPLRVDRKGRPSEFVENPALTVGLMIQPGILAEATNNRAFTDSGLMARFLYSWPRSKVGHRNVDPPPVPKDITTRYRDALHTLAYRVRKAGTTTTLTLSPEADTARLTYAAEVERELGPGGSLAHMKAWASKVVGAAVRMAGLFHAATEDQDDTIDGDTMDAAILLAKYFTAHATRVFDGLSEGAAEHALARRAVGLIRRKGWAEFAIRDLIGAAPTWIPNKEVAHSIVGLLCDLGYLLRVEPERKPGPGRPAAPLFRVHPSVFKPDPAQQIKRIQQNPNIAESAELAEPPTTPYGTNEKDSAA